MKKIYFYLLGICASLGLMAGIADAAVFTGTYDTLTGIGSQTTPVTPPSSGPWQLTSTNATFSSLRFIVNEHPAFADVTNLNVVFNSPELNALLTQNQPNAGGGGGAPRLNVGVDTNGDNFFDGNIQIHLGTSPGFVDSPASLSALSGMNLINNDSGRYDLSQLGGSNFTNHAAAVALFGSATVLRMTLTLDSFGGADKTLDVESINGEFVAQQAVPEPTSVILWSVLGLVAGRSCWRRRRRSA